MALHVGITQGYGCYVLRASAMSLHRVAHAATCGSPAIAYKDSENERKTTTGIATGDSNGTAFVYACATTQFIHG